MQNHKITVLLRSFSPVELREVEKFASSDYMGRDRNLIPLLRTLKKFYPAFDSPDFTKEKIYCSLYPASAFSNSNFRALCSKLYKMCLDYITVRSFRNDETLYKRVMAQSLFIKRNFPQLEKQIDFCIRKLDESKEIDADYFLEKFQIEKLYCEFLEHSKDSVPFAYSYIRFSEYFSKSFLMRLLTDFSEMDSYEGRYVEKGRLDFSRLLFNSINFEALFEEIRKKDEHEYKIFQLYYYWCLLAINKTEKEYKKLKEFFFEIKSSPLSYGMKRLTYIRLTNFRTLNPGEQSNKEMFSLYKEMLEDDVGYLFEGYYMNERMFRNIAISAVTAGEPDWAEDFINNYQGKLKPGETENMKNFLMGFIKFSRKEFDKSLEFFAKVKLDFPSFKEDVYVLMLLNYYELDLYEQALSLIATFKQTLRKDPTMSEVRYKGIKDTLKYYPKLLKIKMTGNTEGLREIEKNADISGGVLFRIWMKQKIKELKKGAD